MEKFKFTLHELVTLVTIVISVTTAYVLLSHEVHTLKDNMKDISSEVSNVKKSAEQIKVEQLRMSVMLDYLYGGDTLPSPNSNSNLIKPKLKFNRSTDDMLSGAIEAFAIRK